MLLPTLLQLCVEAIAAALPLPVPPTPDSLPDEALTKRIYDAYMRLDQARRRLPTAAYSPGRHLAAMRQFAALMQPSVLLVITPCMAGQPGVALCAELAAFRTSLAHLELTAPTASWLSGLQGSLSSLSCLSLRNCPHLTEGAVQQALQQLPQLISLDLSGLSAVSDAIAPTLVSLTELVVLQLNHTSCSDATLEWLTYGQRLHQWGTTAAAHQHGQHIPAAAGPLSSTPGLTGTPVQQWPRSKIRCWHLAYTRVTPRAVDLLISCADILLLDLRGSGVKAAQLAPLRARYALSAVQGAVLSRTAAMVLAAVTLEQFVCADAAQHGAAVAAARVGSAAGQQGGASDWLGCNTQQWVNAGANGLLQAAADAAAVVGLQAPSLTGVQVPPGMSYQHSWQ